MLYIFAGLPGTGKSALSSRLAAELRAAYLRIDVIEQAMRDAGAALSGPEGYVVAYALAEHNLRLGIDVVADSVNPLRITRDAWRAAADRAGADGLEIEVICSDPEEHRRRVETRTVDVDGLRLPTWQDVIERDYESWHRGRITIDTAGRTVDESFVELRGMIGLA